MGEDLLDDLGLVDEGDNPEHNGPLMPVVPKGPLSSDTRILSADRRAPDRRATGQLRLGGERCPIPPLLRGVAQWESAGIGL